MASGTGCWPYAIVDLPLGTTADRSLYQCSSADFPSTDTSRHYAANINQQYLLVHHATSRGMNILFVDSHVSLQFEAAPLSNLPAGVKWTP